jgi:hypothetical protein
MALAKKLFILDIVLLKVIRCQQEHGPSYQQCYHFNQAVYILKMLLFNRILVPVNPRASLEIDKNTSKNTSRVLIDSGWRGVIKSRKKSILNKLLHL